MHDPNDAAGASEMLPRQGDAAGKAIGGLLLVLAVVALAIPLVHPMGREACWLALALAASCGVSGTLALRGAPVAALLTLVLFLGGIAQLGQTEPDWFSEFKPRPHRLVDLAMFAAIALEAVVAAAALARFHGRRLGAVIAHVGIGRLVLLLALTALSSTSLMRYLELHQPVGFAWRLVALGALSAMHVAMAAAIASSPDLTRAWPRGEAAAAWSRRAPWLLAAVVLGVASLLALTAFNRMGLVEDETAYLFQARTFAGGALRATPLPQGTADAFSFYLLTGDASGWYATTAPGWPAVLTLGVLAGVPWLVNPLLGAAAVLLAHRLVERASDRTTANLVALLMATSPWLIESSASMMTHALTLVLVSGGWLLLSLAGERHDRGRDWAAAGLSLLAGLLMGWLFMSRALEGVLVGGLSGLWLVCRVRGAGWRAILAYGAGCIATGSLVLLYNTAFTGDPLLDPLKLYLEHLWGRHGNEFGFGPLIGPPTGWGDFDLWPGHSPLEGLINTQIGLKTLNQELFGWQTGSLLLVWAWLIWDRAGMLPQMMAGLAAAVVAIHMCYWFNAVFYIGPRYWYAAFLPIIVVSAFGARTIVARLAAAGVAQAQPRVFATLAILACFGLTVFVPWRAVEKFAQRAEPGSRVAAIVGRPEFANAVVFLDGKSFHAAAILEDPWLRGGHPILVRDLGPDANARVIAAFPGRQPAFVRVLNPGGAPAR